MKEDPNTPKNALGVRYIAVALQNFVEGHQSQRGKLGF